MRGEKEVPGWREGLRIVFEELDVDRIGGKGGVLDFAERIRNRYVDAWGLLLLSLRRTTCLADSALQGR